MYLSATMKKTIPFILFIALTTLLIQAAFAGGSSSGGGRDCIEGVGQAFYDFKESTDCENLLLTGSGQSDLSTKGNLVTCDSSTGCSKEDMVRLCEKLR